MGPIFLELTPTPEASRRLFLDDPLGPTLSIFPATKLKFAYAVQPAM